MVSPAAVMQFESTTSRPSAAAATAIKEETAGFDGIGLENWQLPADDTEEVSLWREEAQEKENISNKQAALIEDMKQELTSMAAELDACQEEAKTAKTQWTLFENKAKRQEGLRKLAETEAAIAKESAKKEENLKTRWQEQAESEKEVRLHYQQRTAEAENGQQTLHDKADERARLFEEETQRRQQAEEKVAELELTAEAERSGRRKAEQELQKLRKDYEMEAKLRKSLEKMSQTTGRLQQELKKEERDAAPAEIARVKEIQDAAAFVHKYSCIGLQRYWVTFIFKGIYAARQSRSELESPEQCFEGMEDPLLPCRFKLKLLPGGDEAHKGCIGLYWAPLSGAGEKMMCGVPHEKIKVALRILPDVKAAGDKKLKVRESVLDGATSEGFRAFLAEQAAPSEDNKSVRGFPSLLTKAEFEEGGWTTGPDADEMIVQAELIVK